MSAKKGTSGYRSKCALKSPGQVSRSEVKFRMKYDTRNEGDGTNTMVQR